MPTPTRFAARSPDPFRDRDLRRPRAMGSHLPGARAAPRARLAHQGLVSLRRLHGHFFLPAVSVGRLARTVPALRPVGLGTLAGAAIGVLVYEAGRMGLAPQPARLEPAVALFAPVASQRRARSIPGARSGSARSTWWAGRRCSAWRSRWSACRRPQSSRRCASPRSCRCSSTPTCARRAGWACSCSARRATPGITRAACMPETIPTCRCSTSCSAPGKTRATSRRSRAFTTAPRRSTRACCWAAMSRDRRRRRQRKRPAGLGEPS